MRVVTKNKSPETSNADVGAAAPAPSAQGAAPAESFEKTLESLELLVRKLEGGELSLDESLALYERGVGLVRSAQGRLDGMERRLEQLLKDGRTAPMVLPSGDAEGDR